MTATVQQLIANAEVGKAFELSLRIEGREQKPVNVHCTEILKGDQGPYLKKFVVFSHGVEIAQVQSTLVANQWVPR